MCFEDSAFALAWSSRPSRDGRPPKLGNALGQSPTAGDDGIGAAAVGSANGVAPPPGLRIAPGSGAAEMAVELEISSIPTSASAGIANDPAILRVGVGEPNFGVDGGERCGVHHPRTATRF